MRRSEHWLRTAAAVLLLLSTASAGFAADSLKVAVIGGGGTIGQRIVREALDRGHNVTVVARDPTRVTERHERLSIVEGDVLDPARVAELAAGQDVVDSKGESRIFMEDYAVALIDEAERPQHDGRRFTIGY